MIVQVLQKAGYNCGMTGDGVNDAPALKKADVGIAVQGATDAARAASDIVLTNPGLSPIITAINISRQIFQRIQIYLTYRIIASVMIATFFFISVIIGNLCNYTGCHNCNCYESDLVFDNGTFNDNCLACSYGSTKRENVMCYLTETSTGAVIVDNHEIPIVPYFLLSILQLALMIIFNDGCMVAIAWDRVPGSRFPMKWNLPMLFLRTTLIGLCVATAQIAFLIAGMSALIPEGRLTHNVFYHWFGIKTFLQASELQTLMYASISWAGFLVLMSVRVQGHFWKMFTDATSRPDPLLLGAFLFGTSMTLVIAGTCMSANVDFWAAPWPYLGVAALYNLLAFVMVDTVKVFVNDWIEHRFEGEGNSIGEQRRQVIEVVFEPRTDYDGAAHNAFTAVQEQGLKNQKPYHWQATASGANLLGVSGNPTLPHASNNLLADLSPDRRNRQQADYGSGTQDDGGVGISYSGGNLIHKSGRLATV
jgi:H+-transporting ATPase